MQYGDEVLAGQGILVKMLITLEPHSIFCLLMYFKIDKTQVYKTVARLC